jgi:hypothetical protein
MSFTQNINPTFPKQPQNAKVQITNATNLAAVTVITPGANGSKLVGLIATNSDTNPYSVQVKVMAGTVLFLLGTFTVPASAGNLAGTPAVNLLNPSTIAGLVIDSDGNPFLFLGASDTLTIASLTQVTSGQVINVTATYLDF